MEQGAVVQHDAAADEPSGLDLIGVLAFLRRRRVAILVVTLGWPAARNEPRGLTEQDSRNCAGEYVGRDHAINLGQ